jgi:hypothetical protein
MAREKDDINKQKEQTLKRLFDDEWMLIHVDTRSAGVVVPEHLRNAPSTTFKLSRLFFGITEIKEKKVSADLLFGTTRQECIFPFDAIWGASSFKGSNIVWPESAPQEILVKLEDGSLDSMQLPEEKKVVSESNPQSKKPISKGHLTRIK